jgi:protein-tyrosine phosphatase
VEAAELAEAAGLVPLLAHPERCGSVVADPERVRPLAERGWILCLNAPSLVGGHGATAERTSWELLDAGLVGIAASDGHAVGRPPTLDAAYHRVRERRGDEIALPLFDGRILPWT